MARLPRLDPQKMLKELLAIIRRDIRQLDKASKESFLTNSQAMSVINYTRLLKDYVKIKKDLKIDKQQEISELTDDELIEKINKLKK